MSFVTFGLTIWAYVAAPVPDGYFNATTLRWAPAVHLARAYAEFAAAVSAGRPVAPGFDVAVQLHRQLDTVERIAAPGR